MYAAKSPNAPNGRCLLRHGVLAVVLCGLAGACFSPTDIDLGSGAWSTGAGGTTVAQCPPSPGVAGTWTGKLGANELSLTLSETCDYITGFLYRSKEKGWWVGGEWAWDSLSGKAGAVVDGWYANWLFLQVRYPDGSYQPAIMDREELWKSTPVMLSDISVMNDTLYARATGSWYSTPTPAAGICLAWFNNQTVRLSRKPAA